jgi:hypothetical protein
MIDAATLVALENVVARSDPLKRTVAPAMKFVPLRVIVNPPVPALTVEGERLLIEGDPDWDEAGLERITHTAIPTITASMIVPRLFLIGINFPP